VLKEADRDEFCSLVREMPRGAYNFRKYLLNNWTGIEIKKYENCMPD